MAIARLNDDEKSDRLRRFHLIVVVTEGEQAPPLTTRDSIIIRRDHLAEGDAQPFVDRLTANLRSLSEGYGKDRLAEPHRLFAVKEYRAAVIAAITLLETTLRQRLEANPLTMSAPVRRPLSLRGLIGYSAQVEVITNQQREDIERWSRLRNAAVHTSAPVTRAQAREVLDGVSHLLEALGQPT